MMAYLIESRIETGDGKTLLAGVNMTFAFAVQRLRSVRPIRLGWLDSFPTDQVMVSSLPN